MFSLDGKVAIVTGAAGGIGARTAEVLAEAGAKVAVADLNAEGAHAQAARITAAGGDAIGLGFDLGSESSVAALVSAVVAHFGRLDVLHNNAAATHLAALADKPVLEADADVWDDTFRINVRGTMLATKYAVPHLVTAGGGSVINTASGAGLSGDLGHPAYGASKAAITNLTLYAATQFGKDNVRVNAICPGLVVTGTSKSEHAASLQEVMLAHHLTPRVGRPDDIAYTVAFLASDEAAFITGQVISVDGGLLSHVPYYADFRARGAT